MEKGFFYLTGPAHLFEKLRWEYENLACHPGNAWHAFNFFVTAEHMADWTGRKDLKVTEPLLALCSHIANGGKHFEATSARHESVASAKHDGIYEPGVYEEGVYEEHLQIKLTPQETQKLGFTTIDAVSLAKLILGHWEKLRQS